MAIWYIYPIWVGQGGIKDQRKKLQETKESLEVFRQKKQSLSRAVNVMDDNSETVKFAFRYIPTSRDDLLIINSLGKISNNIGALLTSLNIDKAQGNALANRLSEDQKNGGTSYKDVELKESVASINLMANYDQIKSFLENLYRLDMFNEIKELDIEQSKNNTNEAENNTNLLNVNARISFKYLPEINIGKDEEQEFLNDLHFSENYFNFLAMNSLQERVNIPAGGGDLKDGITGQITNPFAVQKTATSSSTETE